MISIGVPGADSRRKDIPMLKGFKEFLSRGNIVDLAIAVVIGTAFTALVTKFTDSIITPLINRIGVNQNSDVGVLRIDIGGGQHHRLEHRALGGDQLRADRRAWCISWSCCPTTGCASAARSSRPTTPRSSCSPKSATCSRKPTAARRASTADHDDAAARLRTSRGRRIADPAAGTWRRPAQISRLDNCPMIWAASGFSVAIPSRTA